MASTSWTIVSAKCMEKSLCHLHSTAIAFCVDVDRDGSAKVNITAAVIELEEGDDDMVDSTAPVNNKTLLKKWEKSNIHPIFKRILHLA